MLVIERGYQRRFRNGWSQVRWQTYNLMRAGIGDESLNKAGIYKPYDLLPFSWEKHLDTPSLSKDDIKAMQAEIAVLNESNAKSDE